MKSESRQGLLVSARQTTYPSSGQVVEWTERNPLGISETGSAVYDPLGNYVSYQSHPPVGQAPPTGTYGNSYGGVGSSLGIANNYGTGCTLDGALANCNMRSAGSSAHDVLKTRCATYDQHAQTGSWKQQQGCITYECASANDLCDDESKSYSL